MLFELKQFRKHLEVSREIERSIGESGSFEILETDPTNLVTGEALKQIETSEKTENIAGKGKLFSKPTRLFALAVLLFGMVGFGYWYFADRSGRIDSVAVLPFTNESEGEDIEYLADGMNETLINNLSQISELSVKSRNSVFRYKEKGLSPKKIGEELNVQAVLMGRVSQQGDDLTLKLELIDTENENVLWGETFISKTKDLLVLQKNITRQISDHLRPKLNEAEKGNLVRQYTPSAEAYQEYLKGRFNWNKREKEFLEKGIEHFKKAIELDPKFALAWSGLADSYAVEPSYTDISPKESVFRAKSAAQKAIELDPELAEAYTSLAYILFAYEWKFSETDENFKKAIELNPKYATAYQWRAQLLGAMGKSVEAIKMAQKAVELEPFSPIINYRLGEQYWYVKRFDEALEQFQRSQDLEPENITWQVDIALVLIEMGKADEAIERVKKVVAKEETNSFHLRALAMAYSLAGEREEAEKILQEMIELEEQGKAESYDLVGVYAVSGDKDKAFEYLNKSFQKREGEFPFFKVDPAFKNLQDDPRFKELLKKIGLPE